MVAKQLSSGKTTFFKPTMLRCFADKVCYSLQERVWYTHKSVSLAKVFPGM